MSREDYETNTVADAARFERWHSDDEKQTPDREPPEPDDDEPDPWLAAVIEAGPPEPILSYTEGYRLVNHRNALEER